MTAIVCSRCKGTGETFNPESLITTIIFPFIWLLERGEDPRKEDCLTKNVCYRCEGKGFLETK